MENHASIAKLLAVLLCLNFTWVAGCGEATPDALATANVTEAASPDVTAEIGANDLAPATQAVRLASRSAIPEAWLADLADQENFFLPPQIDDTPAVEVTVNETHNTVRLIGFATTSLRGESVAKAILKIGDSMEYMGVGDTRDGVSLLEIEQRSVKLQQGRERWTLALNSQPIVNPAQAPNRRTRQPRQQATSRPQPGSRSGQPAAEPAGSKQNLWSSNPPQGRPETPDFPAPPELPEMPDFKFPEPPEIEGFPDLPGFPGFDGDAI